jgi:hypothetical protein
LGVKRLCESCRRERHLRDFDLENGQFTTTCRHCVDRRSRTNAQRSRDQRNAQIVALEEQRRFHIAALVKIDAEIAELSNAAQASSPFQRVELSDVFGDSDSDSDVGFGD